MSTSTRISSTPASLVVLSARRTESHDIPNIISLMNYDTERLFGRINVIYLLEKTNLAVTVINDKNVSVAHAAFLDYPNWGFVDEANWEAYMKQSYPETKCTPLNTLFMHLFVAADEYAVNCCHEIMKTVFKTVPELHFVFLFIPFQEELGIELAVAFEPMRNPVNSSLIVEYSLHVSHRHQYCPQLYIRCARVEDHDDLTPIFSRHNDILRQTYGDYFLAELIEAQDENNLAVVCEDNGIAMGFMSICSEVNVELLHDCFDLRLFHGLCKPHPDDILKPPCISSEITGDESIILGSQKEIMDTQSIDMQKTSKTGSTFSQVSDTNATLSKESIQCPLFLCPDLDAFEDDDKLLQLGLAGDHQRSNAALALQLSHTWLGRCGYLDAGELKDLWRTSEAPSKRVPCLAPAFKPDQPMVQGLQAAVWLGRNQVLHHGPVTWYIDGAHTTSSMQACIRWFHQAALNEDEPTDGSEVRVLLFNVTGDRDTAALLKLLLPCHFDYAVFCPNYTEVSTLGNADQQNFNVTLENVLTRCLQNQNHWNRLMEAKLTQDPWFPVLPEVGGWLKQPLLHSPPIFAASSTRPLNSNSLVFPCISHALQWISQGRDPNLPSLVPQGLHPHPVASSGAVLLKEAVAIRVLVTGSLHLVGGVLKLLDPTLSQ